MWKEDTYTWNEIYSYRTTSSSRIADDKYKKNLEANIKFYRDIQEKDFRSMDSCVAYALEHGNHAAFAKYYINKVRSRYELFWDEFINLMSKRKKSDIQDLNKDVMSDMRKKWKILKPDSWNSCTKTFEGMEYSSQAKYSWMYGNIPSREAIVQMAFYMDLTLEETNQLLMASGHEVLYVLNLLDAVCMFYLNYYQMEDNKKTPAIERLKSVKEMVYHYEISNKNTDYDRVYLVKKSLSNSSGKKSIRQPDIVAYKSPIGSNIDEKIEWIRSVINKYKEVVPKEPYKNDDYFLTHLYHDAINSYKDCNNFKYFIENNIFDYLPYGYLKKRRQVMHDGLYRKNLYKVKYPLVKTASVERIESELNNKQHNIWENRFYDKLEKISFCGIKENDYISIINGLWNRKDLEEDIKIEKAGKFNRINQYFYGRDKIVSDKKQYVPKDVTVKKAFQFTVGDKNSYMKLCIAMGLEDDIELFMCLGNYWIEKYWIKADKSNLEHLEALYCYAMQYRDSLIDEWVKSWKSLRKNSKKSPTEFRKIISDNFPFVHLLMIICRDVQFVLSSIDSKKSKLEQERAKSILDTLIYPIGRTKTVSCTTKMELEDEIERNNYRWYCDYGKWRDGQNSLCK